MATDTDERDGDGVGDAAAVVAVDAADDDGDSSGMYGGMEMNEELLM